MTRKSVKFPPGLRRGPWKTNITRRESDNKNIPSSIFISASNVQRWSNLKTKFRFGSDSELVDYLLTLGENQPKPSLSPDHESDDGWCPANQNGRKKRGPSLRAVLRRSNRKTGAKSDFVLDSIESEEFQSEDSEQSEGGTSQTRKFKENCLRNTTPNDSSNAPPKKRLDSLSGSKNFLNSDDEKEAKAHQLDAELALIVESVDLQPHKENESELYEFKDDSQDEQQISSGSPTVSCSNKSRVAHRRWKSYHKDKRKWKQSYAAVVTDEEEVMKPMQKDEESTSSEKDRRIFKALKKNRILTAYLDSQNKIADSISKDSCQSRVEDDKVSSKEQEDKPEQELSQPSSKKVLETDVVESDDTRSKEDVSEMPIFEKNDTSSGKENQSEVATLSEPIVVEVGERVKLKKRKKKTLHDSEETTTIIKEDNKNLNDSNTSELEKHSKQKRNWKKSLINYELEGQDSESKKMKTDVSSPSSISNISNIALEESHTEVLPNVSEIRTMREEKIKKESHNDSPKLVVPENELSDQDNDSALVSQCSQCCLRHVQQPCPVLNPLNVLEDSISFEQWQLQCQVQVRCSVIEAPRSKSGRLRKSASGSPSADAEKNNKDGEHLKTTESTRVYAEESLPYALGLQVINEEHGKSVVCRSSVAQFTQFGPLVGPQVHEKDISEESDMKHIWEVLHERSNEKHVKYLNTEDPQKSNWLRFIRPAPERHERNITLSVKDEQLYFISIVEIPEGSELLYWADDHISSWSKKKILKSSCGGCNMRFAHPLYYRTHCAVFHDPFHSLTIRKYHCKVCGEAVMGKENIMKHAADLHDGRGAYQCQYCHKFFLRLNYLEMHRTYGCSSNPHRTRPLCDFCGRYFCQPQKLKVHIKRMHSDMSEVLKEFQCKSCLKILGSRAALQRHFKEVHHRDVVVASSCDRCGKSFQNRSNLKIHMLTHSGVKPFRCQQEGCSAAFTTKQCLQFHYKKAHGLSEDALPRIERSIAYTFDAYAGETADGNIVAHKDQMKKPTKLLRKSRKSSTKKTRSQVLQPEGTENRQELMEPVVPVEPIVPEVTECSEPDPVNHTVESDPFTAVADSIQLPDSSLSHTERNPLTPGELIISMPYEEEERQLLDGKVLTPLRTVTHLQHHTAGHKKWLGEVIEVAEEAAAAAMRLSPRLSPHLKRDIYDFDENKGKSKLQYLEIPMRQELQVDVGLGRSKTSTALAPFHHPESASMLVEAALDAAERDICCPSLSSKMSSSPVPMSRSPEPPHPSYCVRSPHQEGPPTLPHNVAFYNANPGEYSVSPSPHLHPLDSYSIPSSHLNAPPRLYNTQSHQVHQHLTLPSGPLSSDDEGATESDCNSRGECAQNLSLSGKDKLYSVPPQNPGMASRSSDYQDHMLLSQQNDLNFSGTVVVSPPHYHLYDLSPDRQRSDVPVTDLSVMSGHRGLPQDYGSYEDVGGSMDLSVPRVHGHGHVSPPGYNTGHVHQYTASDCVPDCVSAYSSHSHPHPAAYQEAPLQRSHISSSSTSPSASPSPGPAHYHSYPQYY